MLPAPTPRAPTPTTSDTPSLSGRVCRPTESRSMPDRRATGAATAAGDLWPIVPAVALGTAKNAEHVATPSPTDAAPTSATQCLRI